MHIVVCIKQVPNTGSVKFDSETNTLLRQGVESIINPFDMFAIEAALRIKDSIEARVTVITMGPPQASEALKTTIGLGVDDAVLLCDRAFAGADTWATAMTLAAAIRKMGDVDLVFCGKQAVDGDTAQVGPELAELLDIPHATLVKKIEMPENGSLKVLRQTDEGVEIWKLRLPALLTVIREIGEPRFPSLKHKMRAKKTEVPIWGSAELGLDPDRTGLCGSFTQVVRVFSPARASNSVQLEGSVDDQADQLFQLLKKSRVPGL